MTASGKLKLWDDPFVHAGRGCARKLARLDTRNVRSIAVIKHAALGDLVLTRPFLLTLRRHFPAAGIVLGISSNYRRGAPTDLVDEVHVVERGLPWWRSLRNYRELGDHDLMFDLTSTARSRWLMLMNRADLKVGFSTDPFHRALYDISVVRSGFKYEAESFLDQLMALGLPIAWPPEFGLPAQPLPQERPYLLYFATASHPGKSWPGDRFLSLITRLAAELPDVDHVIMAGLADWEREVGDKLGKGLQGHANVRLADAAADLFAWTAGARLVISNDTGARNMAIAAGAPTVGIFFDTPPFRYLPRFGRHEAVFQTDRGLPEVEAVRRAVLRVLGLNASAADQSETGR